MSTAGPLARFSKSRPGLYLHLPFCSAICPYCDFAVTVGSQARRRRFVDSLIAEIELAAHQLQPQFDPFDTIYFGGGTPSQLEPAQLELILEAIDRCFTLHQPRLFLEVNPEDVTAETLRAWRTLGFTTLSLGVQSFDDRELTFLGRRHSKTDAIESVSAALHSGFDSVSIDLIYGLPGQTIEALCRSLDAAIELGPDHLSCYSLEIHPRTRFGVLAARGQLGRLGGSEMRAPVADSTHFSTTHHVLASAGYQAYEVSSFARDQKFQSLHNRKYWNHTPYLGLGPSAHSFDGNRRWWNERSTATYQKRIANRELPIEDHEILTRDQRALELIMMSLRTTAGLDLEVYRRRFGTDLDSANADLVTRWIEQGLITVERNRWIPTLEGLALADRLALEVAVETLS